MSGIVIGGVPTGTQSMEEYAASQAAAAAGSPPTTTTVPAPSSHHGGPTPTPTPAPAPAPAPASASTLLELEERETRTIDRALGVGMVHAARWTQTDVGPGVNHNEWNHVKIINVRANAGNHCASYNQANLYGSAAGWGGVDEVCDMSYGTIPKPMQARELDVWCCGPDPQGWRIGMFAVVGDSQYVRTGVRYQGVVEAHYGALVCASSDTPWAKWRRAYTAKDYVEVGYTAHGAQGSDAAVGAGFALASGRFQRGFDATAGDTPVAFFMARGQVIALEHTGSVTVGIDNDYTGLIRVKLAGRTVFAIDYNTGDVYMAGDIRKLP